MKKIPLTQGKEALVDDADFEWLNQYKWRYIPNYKPEYVGSAAMSSSRKIIRMHRLILGAKKGQEVDHVNRDPLDNRKENLRIATRGENTRNQGGRKDSTSGQRGVNFHKPRKSWVARIQVDGNRYFLGAFKTKKEAISAYNKAKVVYGY